MARTSKCSASSKRLRAARREKTRDERHESTTASDSRPRKRVKKEATLDEAEADTEAKQDEAAWSFHFTDLPLELVLEVLGYLEASSLLHLARTTKSLRELLLSRSSIKIWKRAYENTNPALPPPPSGVSFPRFVAFIEDEVCDLCGKPPDDGVVTRPACQVSF